MPKIPICCFKSSQHQILCHCFLSLFRLSPGMWKPLLAHVQRISEAKRFKMGGAVSNPSPIPSSSVPRANYPVLWTSVSLFIKWGDIFLPFLSRPQSKNAFYVIHFHRVHINTLLCFSLTCHLQRYHDQIREGWAVKCHSALKSQWSQHRPVNSQREGLGPDRQQNLGRPFVLPLAFHRPPPLLMLS